MSGISILNKYNLLGEFGIGYTDTGKEFYFDLEDFELIKPYKWHIDKNGYVISVKTIKKNGKRASKTTRMHRLILNVIDSGYQLCVDHINHIKHDNRKINLRKCNNSENQRNRGLPSNNKSGVKGVSWHSRKKKWQANIYVNSVNIYLGLYKDINEARKIRREAEEKYFGEFNYKGEDKIC
ncbi:MAG: hypothetical protein KHZ90_08150 [Veillonella parvula]|uniref:HNH endonuclease n=1 Tax=Veillonella parvula TaxID=29466 RepID=A0A942WQK8_VEIPA|nr:hypothetical protein [Veillonella parvula]MBS4893731.1 hypothetical protein [Veillonella parvula]